MTNHLRLSAESEELVDTRPPVRTVVASVPAEAAIGIFGNFGSGNIGNEGTLEAALLWLRRAYPDAAITCLCPTPSTAEGLHRIACRPIRAVRSTHSGIMRKLFNRIADCSTVFRSLRGLDILLVPGTGILDDFCERPAGMPLTVAQVCLIARLRRIPVAFISVGAGPITSPASRRLMQAAFGVGDYRSFRDQFSKDFMTSIGTNTDRDAVYPDLVFGLPAPPPVPRPADAPLTVGVGVMNYRGWSTSEATADGIYSAYLEKITDFIREQLSAGRRVILLGGEDCDDKPIREIVAAISSIASPAEAARLTAPATESLTDLMQALRQADVLVATRFHNVLCALKLGVPTISIGYSKKNDVLMQRFGHGFYCQHIDDFELTRLRSQFATLLESRSSLAAAARVASEELTSELQAQNTALERLITDAAARHR